MTMKQAPDLPAAARAEALAATTPPDPPFGDDAGDIWRDELERTDLGGGLFRLLGVWRATDGPGGPVVDLGTSIVYELRLANGDALEAEIDTNANEIRRHVHLLWPSGTVDCANTARQLAQLAGLLARPEVREALAEWADEDAAADVAERAARQEGGNQ